ncbi:histidine phosphatase family protein [Clostridium botulinum]|nr:histidine phosphatase family protein [Clostridium botulinum]NFR14507.1 histidine phosphatase family protein [Clostridium botulinum]NFR44682.1 histidine phosphatase family protein [Clostridium botulinum]NFS51868.1 histidine phosphatase family protein [Clostridium botulinum]
MKQTIIYLVRHGQIEWNLEKRMQGHKNSSLTNLGITQANGLYNKLFQETIDVILSILAKVNVLMIQQRLSKVIELFL